MTVDSAKTLSGFGWIWDSMWTKKPQMNGETKYAPCKDMKKNYYHWTQSHFPRAGHWDVQLQALFKLTV